MSTCLSAEFWLDHSKMPCELTARRFISDLYRWRSLLRSHDEIMLYDEIVRSVWGSSPFPRYDGEEGPSLEASIEYLQSLASNLVSETSSLIGRCGWSPGC